MIDPQPEDAMLGEVYSSIARPDSPASCKVVVAMLEDGIFAIPVGSQGLANVNPGLGRFYFRVERFEVDLTSFAFCPRRGARALALLLIEGVDFAREGLQLASDSGRHPLQLARELLASLRSDRGGAHSRALVRSRACSQPPTENE